MVLTVYVIYAGAALSQSQAMHDGLKMLILMSSSGVTF